MIEVKNSY